MKTSRITALLGTAALGMGITIGTASAQAWVAGGPGDLVTNGATARVGILTGAPTAALDVNGNIVGSSNLNLGNDLTVGNMSTLQALHVNQHAHFNLTMRVQSNAHFNQDVHVQNDLNVQNNATVTSDLSVGNDANVSNNLTVTASASVGGSIVSGSTITAGTDLNAFGNINGGGHLLVSGNTALTPASGAGTRLMWVPALAAFRAGSVSGTQWDAANIGTASAAFGADNTASGEYSAAFGDNSTASVYESLVLGRYNVSTGSGTTWNGTDDLLVAGNGSSALSSNAMTLQKNGNLTVAGAYFSSDARLKRDVVPMTGVLSKLESIQPVYYNFNDVQVHSSERQIGFIAQEVQKEFPEAVITGGNGYLAVGYGNMAAVAIQAIKEQQTKIDELTAEKNDMAAQLAATNARMARIEAMLQQLTGTNCCPETTGVNLK